MDWLPGSKTDRADSRMGHFRAVVQGGPSDGRAVRAPRGAGGHVFGEPGSEPILGVFALDGFRLAADPVNRRLVPVPALLKNTEDGRPSRTSPLSRLPFWLFNTLTDR